jgi:hypothetical protein
MRRYRRKEREGAERKIEKYKRRMIEKKLENREE